MGKGKEKKEVQETTWLHTSGDFQTPCVRVMKYLQCSLQQSKQGERCEVLFQREWCLTGVIRSFQYGPGEYLNISFTLSVCSEDYIINPQREGIMVCDPTDSEGTVGTN